jgi:hypothetical protein
MLPWLLMMTLRETVVGQTEVARCVATRRAELWKGSR